MKFIIFAGLIALAHSEPLNIAFKWSSNVLDRNSDLVPDLHVTFENGDSDKIVLQRHNAVDMSDVPMDPCTFLGSLESEPESVVAVTGCPNELEYHVTITSNKHNDVTAKVHANGKATKVKDLVNPEDAFRTLESVYNDEKLDFSSTDRQSIPNQLYMRLVFGYSGTFLAKLNNSVDEVKAYLGKMMTHLQAFYHSPSLGYRVTFDAPAPILDMVSQVTVRTSSSAALTALKELTIPNLKAAGNGQHLGVWVDDNSGDMTAGMAWMDAICVSTDEKNKVSINEWSEDIATAAKIMAHELGHNFGFGHDGGACNGIMAPTTAGGNTWSSCTREFLAKQFQRAIKSDGSFCLARDNPAGVGGSWTPWSKYSLCTKNCGGGTYTRTRICVGSNCPGDASATDACNTQACAACEDKPGNDCEWKPAYGWCIDFDNMKGKCDKGCNVNKASETQCRGFKAKGWCAKSHVNFKWMAGNCALTCGMYCS